MSAPGSLRGDGWFLASNDVGLGDTLGRSDPHIGNDDWRPITVPGNIHIQVGLADPFADASEVAKINDREWWYRRWVALGPLTERERVRVRFEGVDYFCDVFFNGAFVGSHAGMFSSFTVDVTHHVRAGEDNLLAVCVTCPHVATLRYQRSPAQADARRPNEEYLKGAHVTRWDAVPGDGFAVQPMGIWRDVAVETVGTVIVDDLAVATLDLKPDLASLRLDWCLGNVGEPSELALRLFVEPANFDGEAVELIDRWVVVPAGRSHDQAVVQLDAPQLWWTWDLGPQNLYRLHLELRDGHGDVLDATPCVFGIRTFERDDRTMQHFLNGRPLFLRGSWYMSDYFLGRATESIYQRDVLMMRHAHMNHVVGFCTREDSAFYDYCDRLGVLVFLELPFAQTGPRDVLHEGYPRRDQWTEFALGEVEEVVRGLRSHPSLVIWGTFAEAREFYELFDELYAEFSERVRDVCRALDPDALHHHSFCEFNEQHFWHTAFLPSEDYRLYFDSCAPLVSEYGCQALPSEDALRTMMSDQELWATDDDPRYPMPIDGQAYAYHTGFDHHGFAVLWDNVHRFIDRAPSSLRRWIEASQLYHAFVLGYAAMAFRRVQWEPVAGIRNWAFKEVSPRIGFMLVDHLGQPRLGYDWARESWRPLKLAFAFKDALEPHAAGGTLDIPIHVLNDSERSGVVSVRVTLRGIDGSVLAATSLTATLEPRKSCRIGRATFTLPQRAGTLMLDGCLDGVAEDLPPTRVPVKVVRTAFGRVVRVLVIGHRRYADGVVKCLKDAGVEVRCIDERCPPRVPDAALDGIDAIWLAGWDQMWRDWPATQLDRLRNAVAGGVGFIHSGGQGSFRGEGGLQAHLMFTPLGEVLPVTCLRYDVVHARSLRVDGPSPSAPRHLREIALDGETVGPINRVHPRDDAEVIHHAGGMPLLVRGAYGKGRTLAFAGFLSPPRSPVGEGSSDATMPVASPQAYLFRLVLGLVADACGERLAQPLGVLEEERARPLYEALGALRTTDLSVPDELRLIEAGASGVAHGVLPIECSGGYAHLVRLSDGWRSDAPAAPTVLFSEGGFDLFPGERRGVVVTAHRPVGAPWPEIFAITVAASNSATYSVSISVGKAMVADSDVIVAEDVTRR